MEKSGHCQLTSDFSNSPSIAACNNVATADQEDNAVSVASHANTVPGHDATVLVPAVPIMPPYVYPMYPPAYSFASIGLGAGAVPIIPVYQQHTMYMSTEQAQAVHDHLVAVSQANIANVTQSNNVTAASETLSPASNSRKLRRNKKKRPAGYYEELALRQQQQEQQHIKENFAGTDCQSSGSSSEHVIPQTAMLTGHVSDENFNSINMETNWSNDSPTSSVFVSETVTESSNNACATSEGSVDCRSQPVELDVSVVPSQTETSSQPGIHNIDAVTNCERNAPTFMDTTQSVHCNEIARPVNSSELSFEFEGDIVAEDIPEPQHANLNEVATPESVATAISSLHVSEQCEKTPSEPELTQKQVPNGSESSEPNQNCSNANGACLSSEAVKKPPTWAGLFSSSKPAQTATVVYTGMC